MAPSTEIAVVPRMSMETQCVVAPKTPTEPRRTTTTPLTVPSPALTAAGPPHIQRTSFRNRIVSNELELNKMQHTLQKRSDAMFQEIKTEMQNWVAQ